MCQGAELQPKQAIGRSAPIPKYKSTSTKRILLQLAATHAAEPVDPVTLMPSSA
jgi:hypothetical protein